MSHWVDFFNHYRVGLVACYFSEYQASTLNSKSIVEDIVGSIVFSCRLLEGSSSEVDVHIGHLSPPVRISCVSKDHKEFLSEVMITIGWELSWTDVRYHEHEEGFLLDSAITEIGEMPLCILSLMVNTCPSVCISSHIQVSIVISSGIIMKIRMQE